MISFVGEDIAKSVGRGINLSSLDKDFAQRVDLSIVVPCFNEEAVIPVFLTTLIPILQSLELTYELVFINDGSRDKTLDVLLEQKQTYPEIRIINFSRNFGKEAALSAGIDFAQGKALIPIDVDLQDPPELIREMVRIWQEKNVDVVLAKRVDRSKDSFFKRWSANVFYRLNNLISDNRIPENVGDFRLVSRRCVEAIKMMGETQRFMKGVFAWVGFKTQVIEYQRDERQAGKTSFNAWKLWNLALEGITSFSTAPLRVWLYLGLVAWLLSITYGFWIILRTLIFGVDIPGYASMFTAILFLGSTQLIVLGVLGEYIGRIYLESKGRPLYIVEKEY
ncbi:glycosyltransferase family 2 protein [Thiomicrospira cyclica]|uniref:Glycosyl transferase family 2 n=1 Tax=Thiomicrospira cyclica (strain DSM 14477 / JCM 11371 / ALM1) TaxID=717773 RepID=F6DA49_THICA|nr:glycosyltransferase family 2 protein [Thiomicrospira cyclica]AEG32180.1 glycosyl transferase family 2 [Thiomicrospira cyclica ALM1]